MIVMALDHTRDFVHRAAFEFPPENLARTTAAIFFTRWITHFCAPVFMFCAGLGAFMWLERHGGNRKALSRFLVTRGLWLVVLEVTLVHLGFFFSADYAMVLLLVFWALGLSMVVLAALVHLRWRVVAALSVAMIVLHNMADGVRAASFGAWAWLWHVLHQPGPLRTGDPLVIVAYPLIPWMGVMAAGFCAGRIYRLEAGRRSRTLIRVGLALTLTFIVLRWLNVYGDPRPWAEQPSAVFSLLSFLNTSKYPPSLLFLLMTLGPAIALLGLLDGARPGDRNPVLVFGRVPLFYFVLHIPLIHLLTIGLSWMRYGTQPFLWLPPPTLGTPLASFPSDYGWSLGATYALWIAVLAMLYPVCLWFSRVKARRRDWWLSYL